MDSLRFCGFFQNKSLMWFRSRLGRSLDSQRILAFRERSLGHPEDMSVYLLDRDKIHVNDVQFLFAHSMLYRMPSVTICSKCIYFVTTSYTMSNNPCRDSMTSPTTNGNDVSSVMNETDAVRIEPDLKSGLAVVSYLASRSHCVHPSRPGIDDAFVLTDTTGLVSRSTTFTNDSHSAPLS